MIQIFKFNGLWRIDIVNETFQFDSLEELQEELEGLLTSKERFEPYDNLVFRNKKNKKSEEDEEDEEEVDYR